MPDKTRTYKGETMEYRILNPGRADSAPSDELRTSEVDDLVRRFLDETDALPSPAHSVHDIIRQYLEGMAPAEFRPSSENEDAPTARLRATPAIDLCDSCGILNEAVAKRVLYVLSDGVTIPRPHIPDEYLDEFEVDPSEANPLRCCFGCGHVMNASVPIALPEFGIPHDLTCCRGMQTGLSRGTVTLKGTSSFIIGKLASDASAHRVHIDHCGWCGMWLPLLHEARRLGNDFMRSWDRRHSRLR